MKSLVLSEGWHLHTSSVVTQTVAGAHPGAAGGQQHVVQGPALRPRGEVSLDPAEPGPGGTAWETVQTPFTSQALVIEQKL